MIIELEPPQTGQAFDAMRELRLALSSREQFVQHVDQVQRPTGYRLVASVPDEGAPAMAVAGFRLGENLAWGRHLYIDDFSTQPAWLAEESPWQRLGLRCSLRAGEHARPAA